MNSSIKNRTVTLKRTLLIIAQGAMDGQQTTGCGRAAARAGRKRLYSPLAARAALLAAAGEARGFNTVHKGPARRYPNVNAFSRPQKSTYILKR